MARPRVDVVVPFAGPPAAREELERQLARLELRPGDTVTIVDNNYHFQRAASVGADRQVVVHAPELRTPGFARNRGVERGDAEWLVFLDADVVPPPDLLDRYFDPPPGERTALLAGGMVDEPVPRHAGAIPRYSYIRGAMSQERTFGLGSWSFAQSANLACRRAAFEAVGAFRQDIRAGEDADLNYRIRDAGWELERRENAAVVHLSRQTVRGFVAQKAIHGAAAAWLDNRYPGSFEPRRRPGLLWWGVRTAATGLTSAARSRDRDKAVYALVEPLELLTVELGRSLPNERPLRGGSLWNRLVPVRRKGRG